MSFFVDGPQAGSADVCVNLCGDQALVTEEFLHAADVGAAVEEVRGKAVTERVRCRAKIEAGEFQVLEQHAMNAAGGEPATEAVGEDGRYRFWILDFGFWID